MADLTIWKINPLAPDNREPASLSERQAGRSGIAGSLLERLSLPGSPDSLNQASRLLPGGAYTTFRTYEGRKTLSLEDHLRRLEESASLLAHTVSLDRSLVRRSLRAALEDFEDGEARIRLSLALEDEPGQVYLVVEPLVSPTPEQYKNGVKVVTFRSHRENPEAKHTAFIAVADKIREGLPPGAHECLMVDEHGWILEGLSSNFFAVKGGELWTAAHSVLSGITRSIVLQAAGRLGIPVKMESIAYEELDRLEEAFLTSSTRGVLPVRQVDGVNIGPATPGPITQRLSAGYAGELTCRLEEL